MEKHGSATLAHHETKHHSAHHKDEDPTPNLKTTKVTVVGGNTDGRNLFMEIDAFDGEHNNKFYPVFPYKTSAEEIVDYMKELIEDNPKMPTEINQLMQTGIFWDGKNEEWMIQPATGPAVSERNHKEKK